MFLPSVGFLEMSGAAQPKSKGNLVFRCEHRQTAFGSRQEDLYPVSRRANEVNRSPGVDHGSDLGFGQCHFGFEVAIN
jgi:hypothetical protein